MISDAFLTTFPEASFGFALTFTSFSVGFSFGGCIFFSPSIKKSCLVKLSNSENIVIFFYHSISSGYSRSLSLTSPISASFSRA